MLLIFFFLFQFVFNNFFFKIFCFQIFDHLNWFFHSFFIFLDIFHKLFFNVYFSLIKFMLIFSLLCIDNKIVRINYLDLSFLLYFINIISQFLVENSFLPQNINLSKLIDWFLFKFRIKRILFSSPT